MTSERIYLSVPFSEKDRAKGLGARWDPGAKKWWITWESDLPQFRDWLPEDVRSQLEDSEDEEDGRIDWALNAQSEKVPAYLFVAPITCWRCKKAGHFFFVRAGNWLVATEGDGLFREGLMSQLRAFQLRNIGRFQLGLVKKRFSKTVEASYMSQGCAHCDALFGDFPLGDEILEYFKNSSSKQEHHGFLVDLEIVLKDGVKLGGEHWLSGGEDIIPVDPSTDEMKR